MGLVSTIPSLSTATTASGSSATGSFDPRALDAVKLAAKNPNDPAAVRKVAQQFESMFLSMMLKNMRATLPGSDPLANDGSKLATDMYDQQLAQSMSKGKGIGLAEALVKQMERAQGTQPSASTDPSKSALNAFPDAMPVSMTRIQPRASAGESPATTTNGGTTAASGTSIHHDFIDRFKDAALAAAEATGLPAKVILGQAALESGWGKHEVRDNRGAGSFNLFGIKAGPSWTGATVDAVTTEVINGVAQKVVQKFRAYASYADSFIDYAKMVASNPRYEKAVQVAGDAVKFATEMGKSGYATDPGYGAKLARVLTGPLSKLV